MATLTGRTIASSYTELLKTTSASGLTGSLDTVQDGDATDSTLQLSTAGVKSTGTMAVTGVTTLSSDLRLEDDAGGEYFGIGTPATVTTYTLTVPTAATFFPINNINDLYVSGDASKTVTVALLP